MTFSKTRSVPFLIFIFFLLTFVASRTFTYYFPETSLRIKDTHVHHFAYGILILSVVGYISLVRNLSYQNRLRLSVIYGIGLGLAFDEFAMWLQLDDIYHSRQNYDAVMVVSLLLLNVAYFAEFWKRWGRRLDKLVRILILTAPKALWRLVLSLIH